MNSLNSICLYLQVFVLLSIQEDKSPNPVTYNPIIQIIYSGIHYLIVMN